MAFRTIHTSYGLGRIAAAEAAGTQIKITEMAVGDGNGNPIEPNDTMTNLVRQTYRAAINRVYGLPTDPNRFTAEFIIPQSEGGFVIREVGVFDDDGGLVLVGNVPDTYKPDVDDGAFADTIIRVEFVVSNAELVQLIVDQNVAVVTQTWIANNVNAALVIPGGNTNDFLKKHSNTNGDYEWASITDDLNVVVDIVTERQVLAAGQVNVNWSTVTTHGLAVYIEGARLFEGEGADQWQAAAAPNDLIRAVLGKSYPAGTVIIGVQNEPVGAITVPLARAQNLADVPDKSAARINLNVYSKTESDARSRQPGDVFYTAGATAPSRSLKCNGAAVSRATYANLFAIIGTTFGAADGVLNFNLPDLRGEFLRCWDDARGMDLGRTRGSVQMGSFQSHTHATTIANAGNHAHYVMRDTYAVGTGGVNSNANPVNSSNCASTFSGTGGEYSARIGGWSGPANVGVSSTNGDHSHTANVAGAGGVETRPRNVALLACICY